MHLGRSLTCVKEICIDFERIIGFLRSENVVINMVHLYFGLSEGANRAAV